MFVHSNSRQVCGWTGRRCAGAQTERRGGAGPVRGLLGGKDLTGRFLLLRCLSAPTLCR